MTNATEKREVCDHAWEWYDDPEAYNDGFNCRTVAICRKCHRSKEITKKQSGVAELLSVPLFLCSIVVLIVYIIMLISS